jgi:hypothetical protein
LRAIVGALGAWQHARQQLFRRHPEADIAAHVKALTLRLIPVRIDVDALNVDVDRFELTVGLLILVR